MRRTVFFFVLGVLLLSLGTSHAQSPAYPQNCVANVDNATVLLPPDMDQALPNGSSIAGKDTIAVRDGDGNCVGYGVWADDGEDLVIAAAGPTAIAEATSGYDQSGTLSFEVYDASKSSTVDIGDSVTYASCDNLSVAPCRDDGNYEDGAVFVVEAFKDSTVPVELANLSAEQMGRQVRLEWTTAQEVNNAGFHVEHRRLGKTSTEWNRLQFVEGAGTTSEPTTYTVETGPFPIGDHEFRLQQVDRDGSTARSRTVAVEFTLQKDYRISPISPNPVRSRGQFSVTVKQSQQVTASLFNVLGQRVATLYDQRLPANETTTLDVRTDRLSSGQYFVRIHGRGFTETRRLVVVK